VGGAELLPIVTNDGKLKVGDKVPVALDKSHTANGMHITKGKMRGQLSMGMLCGGDELGITDDWYENADGEGALILRETAEIGSDIRGEVGLDDYLIDVSVTSNRQDCNSVYGLAREVAVALGKTVRPLATDFTASSEQTTDYVAVDVQAPDLCPNYLMQGIIDVKIAPSPLWMTQRLAKLGLHGINNIVDITNYVLLEVGQPMHAFDYADLSDHTIVVRRATVGEIIVPLDGNTYVLTPDCLVIADKHLPVGLAGIMGGQDSGIKPQTAAVMFESAAFARENIRKTSKKLGLRSDSSARFEKGIDFYTNQVGLSRALHLVEELKCAKILAGRIEKSTAKVENTLVAFNRSEINRLLGITIEDSRVIDILRSLNIDAIVTDDTFSCIVPPYRDDITMPCDIIEELIRVFGYDNIEGTLMENSKITKGGVDYVRGQIDGMRGILCGLRYNECVFYPFGGKALFDKIVVGGDNSSANIGLLNPLGEELSLMCTSTIPNILQCASLNFSRKNSNLSLFEVGKVYLADKLPLETLPREVKHVTMLRSETDFDTFKEDVLTVVKECIDGVKLVRSSETYLHPNISADIYIADTFVASFGLVHPKVAANFDFNKQVYVADINVDVLLSLGKAPFKFQPLSKFPPVLRDFALVMDESVAAQDILDCIKANCPLSDSVTLFDVYRSSTLGENKKSLAVSVSFLDRNKTLADSDIEKQIAKCLAVLSANFGAVLR
jgi:phenylalanyl-tRNA synthetase beta chain